MFELNKTEKDIKKMQLTITVVLVLFLAVTGFTYAYFAISASNNNTITGEAATVNLTLAVDKIFPTASKENTGVIVPQLSGDTPLSTALKGGCVDANNNVVCQVYKITIQNNGGSATQVVDGKVLFYSNAEMTTDISTVMPNLKWKLITSADATTPNNSVLGTFTAYAANANTNLTTNIFADDVTLATNDTEVYYMIVWIEEKNRNRSSK